LNPSLLSPDSALGSTSRAHESQCTLALGDETLPAEAASGVTGAPQRASQLAVAAGEQASGAAAQKVAQKVAASGSPSRASRRNA
jgi:hypothetical protein